MNSIPYGYCHCGCGEKTNIHIWNRPKKGIFKGEPHRFIRGHNLQMREGNPCWKGGRIIDPNGGYAKILMPDYPRADSKGYVKEHIYIAEKAMGKTIPRGAQVHHHSPTQLVICQDDAYHKLLHQRTRAFLACGNVHWRKCWYCKQYDSPSNLTIRKTDCHHPNCKRKHLRDWKESR